VPRRLRTADTVVLLDVLAEGGAAGVADLPTAAVDVE